MEKRGKFFQNFYSEAPLCTKLFCYSFDFLSIWMASIFFSSYFCVVDFYRHKYCIFNDTFAEQNETKCWLKEMQNKDTIFLMCENRTPNYFQATSSWKLVTLIHCILASKLCSGIYKFISMNFDKEMQRIEKNVN